jgi:hypothetical protein
MTINGFITKEEFQKNIKYLDTVIFLKNYKDWQPAAIENNQRQRRLQAGSTLLGREQEGIALLENMDISFIINKINQLGYNKPIIKLNNFDYYYINIPLASEKDSVFYYALKFCQFKNISDYKNNQSKYSLRNTDQILKQFSFVSADEMVDADIENIPNGNDYHLMCEYLITLEQLNQNRAFINELESIKQKYLQNFDELTKNRYRGDNQRIVRASNIKNSSPYEKASGKSIFSFVILTLLKQAKGVPVYYSNFIQSAGKEYSGTGIYHRLSFDENSVSSVLSIPSINNLVVNNSESKSFYLK